MRRERDGELKRLLTGPKKSFACRADAEAFAAEYLGKRSYHRFVADPPKIVEVPYYGKRGPPAKGAKPEEIRYRVKAELERQEAAAGLPIWLPLKTTHSVISRYL
jgi:hypothetical protein